MAQKPQGVADAMIEAEMWNHSSAPFHGGVTGALYRVSGVGQLSAAERYTPRRLASQPSAAHQYIDEQDNQEDREDARGRIAIRMIPPSGEAPDQEQDHQHKQEQLHRKTPSRRRGPGEGLRHPAATRTATKPSHPHRAGWQDEDSTDSIGLSGKIPSC
jgi:hypothetical protein